MDVGFVSRSGRSTVRLHREPGKARMPSGSSWTFPPKIVCAPVATSCFVAQNVAAVMETRFSGKS